MVGAGMGAPLYNDRSWKTTAKRTTQAAKQAQKSTEKPAAKAAKHIV